MSLSADVSRRLRALAARAGLRPGHVLAQLADRVDIDDGMVSVERFVPQPPHAGCSCLGEKPGTG
ncbi:hypothetical protein AB0E04_24315 [Streptomyces sp. NPDC048251]|uniref:hypothetical protein n=1 Tax=Streptomyces sp. NPDC048251 TaxID=3154501 RepID=UPI00343605FF